ncbi:MAG: hypothetical protein DWQ06_07040 [Calditrichaeota bacterium]|nr:MAG: hypothetical protein DWQ06_07040 [Calditrichota bacterium]
MSSENLAHFLADRYQRRSYVVFSALLPDIPTQPENWEGFPPDLLIIKGKEKKVFAIENKDSLEDETKTLLKWDSYSDNHKYEFEVVVRDEEALKLAQAIKLENKYRAKVTLMVSKDVRKRKSSNPGQAQVERQQNIKRYVAIVAVIIMIGMTLGFYLKSSQNASSNTPTSELPIPSSK